MELSKIQNNIDEFYLSSLINEIKKKNIPNIQLVNKLKSIKNEINDILLTETENDSVKENEYSEDFYYKKPWTKLSLVHKTIKMKEFVKALIIKDDKDMNELKKKLISLIKKKILTKKDSVKYDAINARIISIPSLKYLNGKYVI